MLYCLKISAYDPFDFFWLGIQLHVLLSPYLCFIFFMSRLYVLGWCIDKLGVFHANHISMCLAPHQNLGWGWYRLSCLSPPVIFLLAVPMLCYLCFTFVFIIILCCNLVTNSWERADLLALLCMMFSCVSPHTHIMVYGVRCGTWLYRFVFLSLSQMVYGVRCGTWLYRFLIVAYILVSLPLGAMRSSVVFDCGISWLFQLVYSWKVFTFITICISPFQSFNRWVGAWYLAVAGSTVAQLEVFLNSDYLWVMSPFLCFIIVR